MQVPVLKLSRINIRTMIMSGKNRRILDELDMIRRHGNSLSRRVVHKAQQEDALMSPGST